MTDNAADPEQVRTKARKEKDRLQQEADDLRAILATEHGRRFLWAEISRRRVFATAFHTDALIFAHNEGMRSAGVDLMRLIIDTDRDAWFLMQKEAE